MRTLNVSCVAGFAILLALAALGCGKKQPAPQANNQQQAQPAANEPKPVFPGQPPPPPPAIVQGGAAQPKSETAASTEVKPTDSPVVPPTQNTAAATIEPNAAASSAQDSRVASFAGLTAPKPATWIWHPSQAQFSVAEYTVPGIDGADQAKITVFVAGGSLDANIARWRMQFRDEDGNLGGVDPVVESFEVENMPVSIVEFDGDYRGMGMSNFAVNQKFITAVVDAPTQTLFIRFVGPSKTVAPNREAFLEMIRGLRVAEPQK